MAIHLTTCEYYCAYVMHDQPYTHDETLNNNTINFPWQPHRNHNPYHTNATSTWSYKTKDTYGTNMNA